MVEPNKTYVGIVKDNNDPNKEGRVRVHVMDVYDDIEVDLLPWASPWKDINGNQFNVPDVGKVVIVVFDDGNINNPEYIFSDHYNINLENKIKSLSDDDYKSMKSLIFDHKTQIYSNDSEGLKIDYKYNQINITEDGIDLNLKDNQNEINIGDATADQQIILGNHFMEWFSEFLNLIKTGGLINTGGPTIPSPSLFKNLVEFEVIKDIKFLSKHIKAIDNNKIRTVKNQKREDTPQYGDNWASTKEENDTTVIKTTEIFKPIDGPKSELSNEIPNTITSNDVVNTNLLDSINIKNGTSTIENVSELIKENTNDTISENIDSLSNQVSDSINNSDVKNTDTYLKDLSIGVDTQKIILDPSNKTDEKLKKLIKYLESKNYNVYAERFILNIVGMRSRDDGRVTNKFDDTLYVFYRNGNLDWEFYEYKITTLPGLRIPDLTGKSLLPENVNILAPAQYVDQCILTNYKKDSSIKVLKFLECAFFENESLSKYKYNYSKIKTDKIDIYIKPSVNKGFATDVYNHSADGSQVFKNNKQWKEFISLCENQLKYKKHFTYTLCRKKDYDSF